MASDASFINRCGMTRSTPARRSSAENSCTTGGAAAGIRRCASTTTTATSATTACCFTTGSPRCDAHSNANQSNARMTFQCTPVKAAWPRTGPQDGASETPSGYSYFIWSIQHIDFGRMFAKENSTTAPPRLSTSNSIPATSNFLLPCLFLQFHISCYTPPSKDARIHHPPPLSRPVQGRPVAPAIHGRPCHRRRCGRPALGHRRFGIRRRSGSHQRHHRPVQHLVRSGWHRRRARPGRQLPEPRPRHRRSRGGFMRSAGR